MAPLGFSCTEALLATGLLLLWLAPAALLAVHQPQPFLLVEPSTPVAISCILDETQDGKGNVFWYRRVRGERPRLILSCVQEAQDGFSCEYTKGRAVLHIAATRPDHTSLYLCAYYINSRLKFGNGTALIVGGACTTPSAVAMAIPRALLLLGLILSVCCLLRAWRGLRPRAPDLPASQHQQGELTYAQLRFATPARAAP
eukprot:XP_027300409.1 uncharacterized protein LOC113839890 isoform X1 [Anas platyrhynchos]